ncbi:MAG: hypothetical protein R3E79_40435 [Caldilineaceae bacterium]
MTEKQTRKFVFAGSNGGKMLIMQQRMMKKIGNTQSTMPRLREGRPDHVLQFDEHG